MITKSIKNKIYVLTNTLFKMRHITASCHSNLCLYSEQLSLSSLLFPSESVKQVDMTSPTASNRMTAGTLRHKGEEIVEMLLTSPPCNCRHWFGKCSCPKIDRRIIGPKIGFSLCFLFSSTSHSSRGSFHQL